MSVGATIRWRHCLRCSSYTGRFRRATVDVIDVPDGEHGFDALVPELDSCEPILTAVTAVAKYLGLS
ncbi:hypothetical protein NRB56_45180 [Nocardia sp. RB56]|uniref:Uncharacterized protein n=1 Tax=Nocardia aurantia TaxID=2585199 RepID=A0A7K0DT30_9NOCA|nr:hypothetical protein [Nocardia aurantia]